MKICTKCKRELPLEMFYPNKRAKDGHDWYCQECSKLRTKIYFKNNKEMVLRKSQAHHQLHREERLKYAKEHNQTITGKYLAWRQRAKRHGHAFELTLEYVEKMPLICHYTGVPLTCNHNSQYTVSLDRLDSSKEYTKDNVVFCCAFINLMKNTLPYDQFIQTCEKIVNHYQLRTTVQKSDACVESATTL